MPIISIVKSTDNIDNVNTNSSITFTKDTDLNTSLNDTYSKIHTSTLFFKSPKLQDVLTNVVNKIKTKVMNNTDTFILRNGNNMPNLFNDMKNTSLCCMKKYSLMNSDVMESKLFTENEKQYIMECEIPILFNKYLQENAEISDLPEGIELPEDDEDMQDFLSEPLFLSYSLGLEIIKNNLSINVANILKYANSLKDMSDFELNIPSIEDIDDLINTGCDKNRTIFDNSLRQLDDNIIMQAKNDLLVCMLDKFVRYVNLILSQIFTVYLQFVDINTVYDIESLYEYESENIELDDYKNGLIDSYLNILTLLFPNDIERHDIYHNDLDSKFKYNLISMKTVNDDDDTE